MENYVYHGSPREFTSDIAIPKRNIRSIQGKDGAFTHIFDDISFHATPYKWIALAYTYRSHPYAIDGKTAHYNIGVSLYENNKEVEVLGFGSLEESLKVLYGNGGYVYYFDKNSFITKKGLGNLEMIVTEPTKPVKVERVEDPVAEMRRLGVTFAFLDLGLPENEQDRNYF